MRRRDNLAGAGSQLADLVEREADVPLPAQLRHPQPHAPLGVAVLAARERAAGQLAQAVVQAVDRLHRRRGVEIVGQGPHGDVDEHPEPVGDVLVHRALGAERDRRRHLRPVEAGGVALHPEQRRAGWHEVPDCGHKYQVHSAALAAFTRVP